MEETKQKFEIRLKTEEELRQLALDIVEGKVFTDRHCPPEMLAACFMWIGLGGMAGWSEEDIDTVGTIYEYIDKAFGRGINGFPTFASTQFVHASQMEQFVTLINQAQESRNLFLTLKGGAA